jgi:hypothetical protein
MPELLLLVSGLTLHGHTTAPIRLSLSTESRLPVVAVARWEDMLCQSLLVVTDVTLLILLDKASMVSSMTLRSLVPLLTQLACLLLLRTQCQSLLRSDFWPSLALVCFVVVARQTLTLLNAGVYKPNLFYEVRLFVFFFFLF